MAPRIVPKSKKQPAAESAEEKAPAAKAEPEAEADQEEEAEQSTQAAEETKPEPAALKAEEPASEAQEPAPKVLSPILDNPTLAFGVWIDMGNGPILKRYNKGKTPLTEVEAEFLKKSDYAKKHGAEVLYR